MGIGTGVVGEEAGASKTLTAAPAPRVTSYRIIDLFCGCGGLTWGFTKSHVGRFQSVWANDFNVFAAKSYNENFGSHCTVGDIVDILGNPETVVPQADVVIGGPPCQGFSLLNKNRSTDPRKQLWRPYMEVVQRSGADIFVMENVPQLLGSDEFQEILLEAKHLGFRVASAKLCAADYGVPQTRHRAFIVGCRFTDPHPFFPPPKTHCDPQLLRKLEPSLFQTLTSAHPSPWRTVRDAIADLPIPAGTEVQKVDPPLDLHFGRTPTDKSIARYQAIPHQGMNRVDLLNRAPELTPDCWVRKKEGGTDLFGRLWWDRPAFTIRTEFFKPEKGRYLHPEQHRPITHREAARFQSFPDQFRILGTKIEIARQIGNAVPVGLAAAVAGAVLELLAVRLNR
jgi:DNA (cytosine-5)-methyltransferase 1